jgi:hypothetical protein
MNEKTFPPTNMNLCNEDLEKDNKVFSGTGGVSEANRVHGFLPAFQDTETGEVYLSCHKKGNQAPIHLLEGLPEKLIVKRDEDNNVTEVKASIVPGFVKNEQFYTRKQAAAQISAED